MFTRFSRSFELVKFSVGVLRQDKELLVFPLLSSLAAMLVMVSFIPLFVLSGGAVTEMQTSSANGVYVAGSATTSTAENIDIALVGLVYLVEYFVIFFFNSALVGAALIRMRGGDPTVMDGLRIATSKIGQIFGYAMIAATIGLLLRAIAERVGFIGQIVVGLLGATWTVATYLTVPVLVSRDIGPVDAVKESMSLLKRTWGENLIANAGIGVFFFLIYVAVIGVFGFLAATLGEGSSAGIVTIWLAIGLVICVLLALTQAALQGIFSAALYHYAADGGDIGAGGAVDTTALMNAFKTK